MTVVPSVTTVVGLSVVVTGAADVSGVFSGTETLGAEVGLFDGVATAGTPALVLASALGEVVAAGADAEDPDEASGSGVVAPAVDGGPVKEGGAVVAVIPVGVSIRGASTVVVVVGTAVGADGEAVRDGVCTGGGESGVVTCSRVCAGAAGAGGEAWTCEVGASAGACGVGASG